jgi:DNA-binding IclR family transcriptional regulator
MRSRVSAQISSRVGDRWPLHATGTGLVLLAYADNELQDMVLRAPLVRYSPKTIVDPRELRRVLADVRQTGVVITRQQISMDALAVAVPVRGPYEKVVAAISVVVGLTETVPQRLVTMLLDTAQSISCALSAAPTPVQPAR